MHWLSEPIDYESCDDLLDKAYKHFLILLLEDMFYENTLVELSVSPDNISKTCKTFTHLTTVEIRGTRIFDKERTKRIHWIRDILNNYRQKNILIYNETRNKCIRTHFLIPKAFYLLIIEKNKRGYYVVTAFHLDNQRRVNHYMRNYRKSKKNIVKINEKAPMKSIM